MTVRRASALFVSLALGAEAIYLTAAVLLPWWRYGSTLQSWRKILAERGSDSRVLVACLLAVGLLMVAYVWGWRLVVSGSVSTRLVWGGILIFGLTVFWLLPITSDLFSYLSQAHQLTDLGTNPLATPSLSSVPDQLQRAYPTRYATFPSVYGPAWVLISSVGTLGPHDVAAGLLYLKSLAFACYLVCAWLLGKLLSAGGPRPGVEGIYLFAWNPLVILMAVGDGHNDIVMMSAVLLSIWLLMRRQWVGSFFLLTISVWIKYTSAILLPLLAIHMLRPVTAETPATDAGLRRTLSQSAIGDRRRSLSRSLLSLGGCVAGSLLVLIPLGDLSWLAGAAQRLFHPVNWAGPASSFSTTLLVAGAAAFVVSYLALARRALRKGLSFWDLADWSFVVFLLAFLLGSARSQPWHLIWPVALAPLSRRRWAVPIIMGLSSVMLAAQLWIEWGAPGLASRS